MTELEAWVDRVVALLVEDALEPTFGAAAIARDILERELRDLVPDPDALQWLLKWQAERAGTLPPRKPSDDPTAT